MRPADPDKQVAVALPGDADQVVGPGNAPDGALGGALFCGDA